MVREVYVEYEIIYEVDLDRVVFYKLGFAVWAVRLFGRTINDTVRKQATDMAIYDLPLKCRDA